MNAVFADTCFFLAILNEKDLAHDRAIAAARANIRPLVTTAWVLTEFADAFSRPSDRPDFVQTYRMPREHPWVKIVSATDELFERGIGLFSKRSDKDWSLTDCISFVVMADLGITGAQDFFGA